ncbi:hypothetical protein H4C44_28220 [Pseudomonas juntendi]|uniref:Uncharacterized protein n=1 Tax=Pseudomonas juntendi TaxID=2666183 RepID=A0A7W2JPY9_9PSED|nr:MULTISPECIES: hypothetical protein [Pseudomonas]EGB96441.1 hypothetical protein G1E_23620 [Pseudomonas sp. TJI-51]RRV63503.1 hypothetical protein EGJ15_18070 [Pseudomonas sp. p99-361]MBA6063038.1 hypothetical protein [Pseudomonas juntendi]MBA6128582.1 hypothetical protein [Pseudomonas juntendi]MBS6038963.1 hypothetical protein [Pseudomonas sp.]
MRDNPWGLYVPFQALRPQVDAALAAGPAHWAELRQRNQGVMALVAAAREKRLHKAWAAVGSA